MPSPQIVLNIYRIINAIAVLQVKHLTRIILMRPIALRAETNKASGNKISCKDESVGNRSTYCIKWNREKIHEM